LNKFSEALIDAEKTVELKPDWSKGYSRVGAAYVGLNNYNDAVLAYRKGLKIDPNNEVLKSGLSDAQSGQGRGRGPSSSFGDAFYGPEMWAKLTSDPRTRTYLQQPDFVRMMQDIQKNPNNLNFYMKDQRVMQAFGVLLGMKWDTRTPEEGVKMPGGSPERKRRAESEPVKEEKRAGYKAQPVPQPEPVEVSEEEKELKERKVLALKEKEAGNAAYKKKDFENAVQLYSKAIELDDADISFLTNRAAVFLEMGKV